MKAGGAGLLAVVYVAFIALGLPDTVLGTAWPVMHGEFGVGIGALGFIGLLGALAAVASSTAYGWLRHRPPPWLTLVGSVALMTVAMLLLSGARQWWLVLVLSVAWGLCGGFIDIELNHFAARHFSRRHMSWLHGCWGIGAATGPLIMAAALAAGAPWRTGFWALAAVMGTLALTFWATRGLWPPRDEPAAAGGSESTAGAVGAPPRVAQWLGPLCFFLVVAAEFAMAIWIPSILVEGHGLPPAEAGRWATLFFGALTLGRFALGAFGAHVGNRVQVRAGIAMAIAGGALFVAQGAGLAGAAGIALMGLGSAPLFPALMHETTRRYGDAWSSRMVARQMIGAYVAGAAMPLVYAALVARVGVHAIVPTAIVLLLALAASSAALDRATPPLRA